MTRRREGNVILFCQSHEGMVFPASTCDVPEPSSRAQEAVQKRGLTLVRTVPANLIWVQGTTTDLAGNNKSHPWRRDSRSLWNTHKISIIKWGILLSSIA